MDRINVPKSIREKVGAGRFLSCLLCIMGWFLAHPNPKGEALQGLSFMEGPPVKGSTLAFPVPWAPCSPLKQNSEVSRHPQGESATWSPSQFLGCPVLPLGLCRFCPFLTA